MKLAINLKSGKVEEKNKEVPLIVGIDLGTTNSLIAHIRDGESIALLDEDARSAIVPSVIYFDENDQPQVGKTAKAQLVGSNGRTIYSVKRLFGKSYEDVQQDSGFLGYEIVAGDDDEQLVKVKVGPHFYSPIELSAIILRKLKANAEKVLNKDVSKAVITVPAYFNDVQRQATRDAGKLAGLDVLRIINEPTAAALAYGVGVNRSEQANVAVYDLGGGTFDISVLRIEDGIFEVLSTHGDTVLGGDDFDKAVAEFWMEKYFKDKKLTTADIQRLRTKAEEAKRSFSNASEFSAEVAETKVQLSLAEFEKIIAPFVERTIASCAQALKDSGLSKKDIDKVIMVGGSSRTKLVKEQVSAFFGQSVYDEINPDEVVAKGAAIQADILAGNRKDLLLIDVTPLSLGIETMGGLMDTIIGRNTKVPCKAGRQYTTSVDGQTKLKVAVYQGERELVKDNRKLGEFVLSDIPPMGAGLPKIDIQFMLDADGILVVKARELRSGKETQVEIKSTYGISEEEMSRMLLDSIQNAEADMKERSLMEAITEASSVLLFTRKFIDQNKVSLTDSARNQLEDYASKVQTAIDRKNKDEILLATKALNDYASPLAQEVMDQVIKESLKGSKI